MNRSHSKISKLPPAMKNTIDQMILAGSKFDDVADYIKSEGTPIHPSTVCRYANRLHASLQELRMVQENYRILMEEVNRYPLLDTTEALLRLTSHQMLEAIQSTPAERWKDIQPDKLMGQISGLIRAASYKANIDLKNKEILDTGYEQVKKMVFDAMMKERPDLYNEVSRFLSEKQQESGDAE